MWLLNLCFVTFFVLWRLSEDSIVFFTQANARREYQRSCVLLIRTTQTKVGTSLKFGPNLSNGIFTIYRVSQEECARLRESVPCVKLYRYNPKHLYPK